MDKVKKDAVFAFDHKLYTDDYLDSAKTVAGAIGRARDVTTF